MVKQMERENLNGKMVDFIKENIKMDFAMVMEYINGI
jgi:hypothetical protein